jgi:hypothetical protein
MSSFNRNFLRKMCSLTYRSPIVVFVLLLYIKYKTRDKQPGGSELHRTLKGSAWLHAGNLFAANGMRQTLRPMKGTFATNSSQQILDINEHLPLRNTSFDFLHYTTVHFHIARIILTNHGSSVSRSYPAARNQCRHMGDSQRDN